MSTRRRDLHRALLRQHRIRRDDVTLLSGSGEGGLDLGKGPPRYDEQAVHSLGMTIFLASLAMIFGATLAAYGIFRWREGATWAAGEPMRNVVSLALATGVLVTCDVLTARARAAHRDLPRARKLTGLVLALASVYLVVQLANWSLMLRAALPSDGPKLSMEATMFMVLTFTHAVHVLGGIVANGVVYQRSGAGRGPRRVSLEMLFRYWRFLTIVWLVIVAVLLAT